MEGGWVTGIKTQMGVSAGARGTEALCSSQSCIMCCGQHRKRSQLAPNTQKDKEIDTLLTWSVTCRLSARVGPLHRALQKNAQVLHVNNYYVLILRTHCSVLHREE